MYCCVIFLNVFLCTHAIEGEIILKVEQAYMGLKTSILFDRNKEAPH